MKLLVSTLILLAFQASFAGVAEKKAIKEGDAAIAEYVVSFKTKCGTDVSVKSNHAAAEKMKEDGRTPDNVISVAGGICAGYVGTISDLCSDADYKEEIVKIKTITCNPNQSLSKSPYFKVSKDGATLKMEHHPTTLDNSGAYTAIKSVF